MVIRNITAKIAQHLQEMQILLERISSGLYDTGALPVEPFVKQELPTGLTPSTDRRWNFSRKGFLQAPTPVPSGKNVLSQKDYERSGGAAILEAALLLPLLIFLFAGAYDGFRAVQSYETLAEVTQEAVRYAARVPSLEPGTYRSLGAATAIVPSGHRTVHDRIRAIIAMKPWHVPLSNVEVVSQLQTDTGTGISGELGPSDASLAGVITIRVTGEYNGLFTGFLFNRLPLQVMVASPLL